MILISHRGNITGKNKSRENQPEYIDDALSLGYDVEVDIWLYNGEIFLGHDEPLYQINIEWLENRRDKLWVHCKNIDSLIFLQKKGSQINYFWHETDTVTLTSLNYIWAHPGKQPIHKSISVLPELNNDIIDLCLGICSDFIKNYEYKNNNI